MVVEMSLVVYSWHHDLGKNDRLQKWRSFQCYKYDNDSSHNEQYGQGLIRPSLKHIICLFDKWRQCHYLPCFHLQKSMYTPNPTSTTSTHRRYESIFIRMFPSYLLCKRRTQLLLVSLAPVILRIRQLSCLLLLPFLW